MAVKTKSASSPTIKTKARQLLAWAREMLRECKSAPELYIVVFGPHGKARTLFPTKKEWEAFHRSEEIEEIRRLIEQFAGSLAQNPGHAMSNGHLAVTLPLPKSVHAALLAEAAAEGVSLDQLCLSKLVAQLRQLV